MILITKMPPRVYMQRVHRNRGIYCDVKTQKCTSVRSLCSLSFLNCSKASFLENSKSRSNLINVLFLFSVGAFDELAMVPTTKTLKSETK